MATYKEIQNYIRDRYRFTVKTCWIAHMKEKCGLHPKQSPNRIDKDKRIYPCPPDKEKYIIEAFKFYKMI